MNNNIKWDGLWNRMKLMEDVLVVEDELGITKVCMRTLTAKGFQVDFAENGEVA
jgi:DNA-binding NtrC family response regulator